MHQDATSSARHLRPRSPVLPRAARRERKAKCEVCPSPFIYNHLLVPKKQTTVGLARPPHRIPHRRCRCRNCGCRQHHHRLRNPQSFTVLGTKKNTPLPHRALPTKGSQGPAKTLPTRDPRDQRGKRRRRHPRREGPGIEQTAREVP